MVIKLTEKQLDLFNADKKSAVIQQSDNLAEKKRMAQVLLSNIEEKLDTAIKLYNRQNVSKK